MDTTYDIKALADGIVYVRPVEVASLPDALQEKVGDLETIFAVHDSAGTQLALVANRKLAFHLARENKMRPVTVH